MDAMELVAGHWRGVHITILPLVVFIDCVYLGGASAGESSEKEGKDTDTRVSLARFAYWSKGTRCCSQQQRVVCLLRDNTKKSAASFVPFSTMTDL